MTITRRHVLRIVNVLLTVSFAWLALAIDNWRDPTFHLCSIGVGWFARVTFEEW